MSVKSSFFVIVLVVMLSCKKDNKTIESEEVMLEKTIEYLDLLSNELNHGMESVEYLEELKTNLE